MAAEPDVQAQIIQALKDASYFSIRDNGAKTKIRADLADKYKVDAVWIKDVVINGYGKEGRRIEDNKIIEILSANAADVRVERFSEDPAEGRVHFKEPLSSVFYVSSAPGQVGIGLIKIMNATKTGGESGLIIVNNGNEGPLSDKEFNETASIFDKLGIYAAGVYNGGISHKPKAFQPGSKKPAADKNVFRLPKAIAADMSAANLALSQTITHRTAGALLAKRFLVFTGLAGSGKTQLAQAFSKWITPKQISKELFSPGLEVEASRSIYKIEAVGSLGMKVHQSGNNSFTFLPFDLIDEWVTVIRANGFDETKNAQEIQAAVQAAGSGYSNTVNSFHSPLKALAFHKIKNEGLWEKSKCVELIAVGADWTSNENLLGYPDALNPKSYRKPDNGALDLILRAKNDPENPYFLILDEMNLSHVERYFADFLSAMESGEAISLHDDTGADWDAGAGSFKVPAKLKIPKNLFVIGTVNVDETTYMFSPKVLDRANVIEFRVSDDEMKSFLGNPVKPDLEAIAGQGAQYAKAFVAAAQQKDVPLDDDLKKQASAVLMKFFPQLKEAGAEFGYRTAHEICRFVYFHKSLTGEGWEFNSAMDAAIMQKLLPKLHGSKKKLGPILEKLNALCDARFPASSEKIVRMQKRLVEHGFTSFAEA